MKLAYVNFDRYYSINKLIKINMKNEKEKIFIANVLKQSLLQIIKIDPDLTKGRTEIPIGFSKIDFTKSQLEEAQIKIICTTMHLFEKNKTEQNIIRNLPAKIRLRDFEEMSANDYITLLEEISNNLKSNNELNFNLFKKNKATASAQPIEEENHEARK